MLNDTHMKILVAVEGGADDWAAYEYDEYTSRYVNEKLRQAGLASALADIRKIVADSGVKMRREQAAEIFPGWNNRLSWRR